MSKKKQKLDEGMVMISSLLPVGGLMGMPPKRKDNFEFKGLPGQFDKSGKKIYDENGSKIKEATDKDHRKYNDMLYNVKSDIDELIKLGEDYSIWQNAKATLKALKQAAKALNGVS